MKLIDKDVLIAEIERLKECNREICAGDFDFLKKTYPEHYYSTEIYNDILSFINTLEIKEVDLEKLGEITRHLIAVKEHIEDMRLDKEEWFILEKIGYPERFNEQKEE